MTVVTPTKGKGGEEQGLPLNAPVSVARIHSQSACSPLLVKHDESPPSLYISTTTMASVKEAFCVRTEMTGVTLSNNVDKLH